MCYTIPIIEKSFYKSAENNKIRVVTSCNGNLISSCEYEVAGKSDVSVILKRFNGSTFEVPNEELISC